MTRSLGAPTWHSIAREPAHAGWDPGPLATFLLAITVTAIPVVLHLMGQPIGIAACALAGLLLAGFAAPAVPMTLIFAYLFQNLFVALVSPGVTSLDELNAMRGYNFLLTAVVWLLIAGSYWTMRSRFDRQFRTLIDVTTAALVITGIYFLAGLLANPSAAIVYLRNVITPILMFQVFALVAYRHRLSVTATLIAIAAIAVAYGYIEFIAQEDLFRVVNGDTYLDWRTQQEHDSGMWLKELQETGRVIRSYRDAMVVDFLNTPMFADLGLRLYRILGPNFHPISYAYAVAFFSIVLFAIGRGWYVLIALPLLFVTGSKGALIFVAAVIAATAVLRRLPGFTAVWIYAAALVIYIAAGITMGIQAQDYHVIGFIGGLKGFLSDPIGRGLGVGGNLSFDMTSIDWNRSQQLGYTDVAVESAIGVLLYQMGVFGAVIAAGFVWIGTKLWSWHLRLGGRMYACACFAVLVVTANGVFQEEAIFAPLALALVMGLAGLLLGRAHRTRMVHDPAVAPGSPGRQPIARHSEPAGRHIPHFNFRPL